MWLALLGFLLSGYFVLGGYDYGTQLLYPFVTRSERERRTVRGALGPFFFGNEVWLVAFAGVLFGAFPFLEGELLSGLYPLLVTVLLGLVVGKAAVQLRGRMTGAAARRLWDALIVIGGVVPAAGWGMVAGVLLHGVPVRSDGTYALDWSSVVNPFVLLAGLSGVLLLGAHGAAFLSIRVGGLATQRIQRAVRPLLCAAVVAVAVTVASARDTAITEPWVALALASVLITALLAGLVAATRGRYALAFAATSIAAALPVPLIGAGLHPYLLVSAVRQGITVTHAAADSATLTVLLPLAAVIVPIILAYQVWSWRLFRGRVEDRTLGYF
ncbi:cytochrome d ubiquinol oxidase subunit II [Nocardia sp. NPDC020380]|uniref:cytochrome d ubiquinol oxidase subunit II n=1 Tax=Nocardia sp. NPDC020380 TaxID=3364309 RepID=UPI0037890F22